MLKTTKVIFQSNLKLFNFSLIFPHSSLLYVLYLFNCLNLSFAAPLPRLILFIFCEQNRQ
uniref:Uncharacterized protein n=1 Tax=Anguilla anguilla TaxID=7936 RepID=A0A0E9V238_ANGAN